MGNSFYRTYLGPAVTGLDPESLNTTTFDNNNNNSSFLEVNPSVNPLNELLGLETTSRSLEASFRSRNRPKVHKTITISCDVNLHKETLNLIPIPPSPNLNNSPSEKNQIDLVPSNYQISFKFDSNVECQISIFYVAIEKRDENNVLNMYEEIIQRQEIPKYKFQAGLNQEFIQPLSDAFHPGLWDESSLISADRDYWPLIILIEPITSDSIDRKKIISQSTFSVFLKCSDDSFVIKPLKSKIEYYGTSYIIHDIYGLERIGDVARECVICISETRDTIVLPCRHLCLCSGCAEMLRFQTNKCPICRSKFTSLLKIKLDVTGFENENMSDIEEEEPLVLNKKKKKAKKTIGKDKRTDNNLDVVETESISTSV